MACATTSLVSKGKFGIELSTNGTAWSAVTPQTVTAQIEQSARISPTYVGGSDYPILMKGAYEAAQWTVRGFYTEDTAHLWETVRAAWSAAGDRCLYVRLTPKGSGTGNDQFTTSADGSTAGPGVLASISLPAVEAGSGDPVPVGFVLQSPAFIKGDAT